MSKITKMWLIIGTSLVLIGCIIFGGVMTMLQWDFRKLSTGKYETSDYEITETFKSISIITDTADIVFLPSENANTSVSCYEQRNAKHFVAVKDGALVIQVVDARKWYEHIGINFGAPKITVCIPRGEYGALFVSSGTGNVEIPNDFKFESMDISENTGNVTNYASASENMIIKTSTGNIRVENVSAGTLELSVSTGKVKVSDVTCDGDVTIKVSTGKTDLTNIRCKNVVSSGNTGAISLKNVIAAEKFTIERSTGDVKLDGCDAAEIFVGTNTGDVRGSLLAEKIFIVQTETGHVDVPKTEAGGKCEITTSTGDIQISIKQ